jgi:hypothetical protein
MYSIRIIGLISVLAFGAWFNEYKAWLLIGMLHLE